MTTWNAAELRVRLADRLTLEELRALSFDLGLPEEERPSKDSQVRAILTHLAQRQALDQLIAWLQRHRPDIDTADLATRGTADASPPAIQQGSEANWADLLGRVGGDVIIAEIGGRSQNVAVGKHITQTNVDAKSETLADEAVIRQGLAGVRARLPRLQPALDPMLAQMVEFQLDLLTGELTKPEDGAAPSANAITRAGGWLVEHVPALQPDLRALFQTPAVSRVLARAGNDAMTWADRVLSGRQDN